MYTLITNYLEPLACLLYLVAFLINYRRSKQPALLSLFGYYAVATTLLTIGSIGVGKKNHTNIWVYDIVVSLMAVCVGFYFYRILASPAKRRTVLILIGVYALYAIGRNLTLEERRLFDSFGYSIVSASIVVYAFMYFHQVLKNVTEANILREFNFWLASGYLLYYAGSFIIFVSYYYFTVKVINTLTKEERALLTALWGLHNVLLFVGAISLLIGSLWVTYRRKSA